MINIRCRAYCQVHKITLCVIAVVIIILYQYFVRHSFYSRATTKEDVSLRNLLAGAIAAAEIGGIEVVRVHDTFKYVIQSKGKTKEGIDDPVTMADYKSHCVMYQLLSSMFPEVLIISEEQSQDCDPAISPDERKIVKILDDYDTGYDVLVRPSDVTVWIDPLDATKEFTENLLEYVTTMVCVAVKGIPFIGVIHKPFVAKQTYWAWLDHGVSANFKNVPSPKETETPILIVSRSHAGRVHNASKIAFEDNVKIISAAGAGYKSLEVASGNATAYIHMTNIKKWDVCAGAAIINALGGTVTSLSGEPTIDFSHEESAILERGLLATMRDHNLYLDKFRNL